MNRLLRFLLPLRCLGCGVPISDPPAGEAEPALCLDCRLALAEPPAPRCPRCDLPRGTGRLRPEFCAQCDDWPPIVRRAVAGVVLRPPADALVQSLKYAGWRRAAEPMAERIARRLVAFPELEGAPVVPVPTTERRERRRGYNQARVLAEALARRRGVEVLDGLARRVGSASQVALPRDERRANVSKAFVPGPDGSRIGAVSHTILVDDVLTTGATAGSAAEVLAALGSGAVTVAAFARALPHPVGRQGGVRRPMFR
ncbi:ComF family protein [Gemmatimonadota bacterium DH-20]|uniref:ComF family protein n=1 Tax=Gaopeijia maritima TaxID=3119007 RepID=A0ABU9EAI0_9BACT